MTMTTAEDTELIAQIQTLEEEIRAEMEAQGVPEVTEEMAVLVDRAVLEARAALATAETEEQAERVLVKAAAEVLAATLLGQELPQLLTIIQDGHRQSILTRQIKLSLAGV